MGVILTRLRCLNKEHLKLSALTNTARLVSILRPLFWMIPDGRGDRRVSIYGNLKSGAKATEVFLTGESVTIFEIDLADLPLALRKKIAKKDA